MNEERNGSKWLGRDHHQHTFHDLDGRRRRQARLSRTARPTNSATTSPRTASTSTTFRRRCCYLMGMNHEKLTFRSQGRDYRLTDVHGKVVKEIVA